MAVPVEPEGALPTRRFCEVDDQRTATGLENAEDFSAKFLAALLRLMVEHQAASSVVAAHNARSF
jgi:hypothetical protein